ncbi:probable carboxylesterase 15 [Eucalyptus grandis]|uniref:probable carboxylesterase 15 n=1 Tax=Eucalyptus grandis TaxID=71139 RepID=UPI00192E8620|nr:probable carboxylesterase 15 [Eucalyptus grandis]
MRIYGDGLVYLLVFDELDFSAIPTMNEDSIFCKDFELRDLQLWIYKSKTIAVAASSNVHKLPIILYVHGGGFCNGSRVWPNCHDGCLRLTSGSSVAVVAPDFGLLPEHRVPVIFDNVIRTDQGLRADFALFRCGRTDRIGEELGQAVVEFGVPGLVLEASIAGWRDERRPMGQSVRAFESMALDRILVIAGGTEMMKDRIDHHVKRLAKMGKVVEYRVFEGQRHDFFLNNSCSKTGGEVAQAIMRFIYATSA